MLLAWVLSAHAGSWDDLGPMPTGSRLASENVGPDLVRWEVEGEGGRYWLDVTSDNGNGAFCLGGGLALQVRKSLDDEHESFDLDPVPAPVRFACDRLGGAALSLRSRMASAGPAPTPGPDGAPVGPDGAPLWTEAAGGTGVATVGWASPGNRVFAQFSPRPWQGVVVAWAVAALACCVGLARRENRIGWLIFGVALALRMLFSPFTAILGGDAAYERLNLAFGRGNLDRYYGETWPSLFGLVHKAVEGLGVAPALPSDIVHHVNLVASAATAALLWALCRRAGIPSFSAAAAGFGLAALPQAVGLARIEDHAVLVGFFQVVAGWAALGPSRRDEALAVLSAGLLAHLRPEQVPMAGVLLMPLLVRRRWVAFALGTALVLSRIATLPRSDGSGPIQFARLLSPQDWRAMVPAWVNADAHPLPALYALAGFAILAVAIPGTRPRTPRLWIVGWLVFAFAATTLLYLPKELPAADPLRFSLPAQAWLVALAALGAAEAARTWAVDRRIGAAVAGLALLLSFAGRGTQSRPWVWEEEYRFLRDELLAAAAPARGDRPLPADPADLKFDASGTRGWYDNGQDPNAAFGCWLSVSTGMTWVPWGAGTPKPGDLVYRGSADRLAGRWSGERCGLDPVAEREVAPNSDGWVDFGVENVRFTLYRVRDCGGAAG